VRGMEATSIVAVACARQHAARRMEDSEQLAVGHSDATGSPAGQVHPWRCAPRHVSCSLSHQRPSRSPRGPRGVGDRRRIRWARWSPQRSERPLIRPCQARRASNALLGSSARQPLLLRGAKLARSKHSEMSSPTASMSSFADGVSSVFQTLRERIHSSSGPSAAATTAFSCYVARPRYAKAQCSVLPPAQHVHRLRPCAATVAGGSQR